ncbi:PREDICTED: DNA-dependent protein kinase catalytic subunit-like [Ceratosolen solmsi marchali]|uniref:DNA-dependent protein kinase catalytic subunit-like n=1 Tax=Ceratosolen solmsi marchali TaxID=326594 RepID=A0AAJ6YKY2_9HYME|nr:PREDICTED: DNA-dependent protein kinase catalytic subunit-like [Ceratosolen solmsi marchali]
MWLFEQCGSLNIRCRHKSMELFENLYLFIPGNKSIEEFFNSRSASSINRLVLKNLDKDFEYFTANQIQIFLKSLDFYIWVFNKGFLTPESVFDAEDAQDEVKIFFRFFSKFLSFVINENIADASRLRTNTANEAEELVYLFNKAILEIFRFISIVLLAKKKDSINILENLCTDNLYILIVRFTLYPQKIGLTARILQTITSQQLENWFIEIMKHLPDAYISKLTSNFLIEKTEDYIFFNDINDIINVKSDTLPSKHFMRNIIILKKCKLFNFEDEHRITIAFAKEKIRIIFEGLKAALDNGDVLKKIDNNIRIYLEGVVQFFLLDYQPELLETLIDLIVSGSSPSATSTYVISHQEYFLDTFKVPIFSCVMKNPTCLLIEELLIFAQHNRSENSETLAGEVIKRCATYRSHVGNVVRRGDRFFNMNRVAVSLLSNSSTAIYTEGLPNALYAWIVDELSADTDCDRKFAIMESFLVCMIDEAGPASAKVPDILGKLRDPDSSAWLEKLRTNEVERSRAVQCFHVLARLLEVTRSSVIYEGLARYAAGACELLTADSTSNSLRVYLAMISAEKLLKSLQAIYELFKMRSSSARERLDLVRYFMLSTLESCRIPVLGKFYEQNAREMADLVAEALPDNDPLERRGVLVTKIGCYRLLELMFCKLPPSMIIIHVVIDDKHTDLGLFLGERAMDVRKLVPPHQGAADERELTRLLHCAAFNFFISMACARHDEAIYQAIFREADNMDQFVWRRIVDCERTYELTEANHSFRWQPISIRRMSEEVAQVASYAAHFRRDSQRMADLQMMGEGSNGRQWIGLEYDEFNAHECAATITGAIVHLVNSKVSPLPAADEEPQEDRLPDWLVHFRKALATDAGNVKLFLMRIISNTRAVFVPYLRSLFVDLVGALCHYLADNSLNYLVRDMLLIIAESKYELRESNEARVAQKLVEIMIERVYDRRHQVYDYNLEMLERLVIIWSDSLKCPENFDTRIQNSNVELTTNVVLILLRHGVEPRTLIAKREIHAMIRRSMFMWQEPITPRTFETLGWIIRYIESDQRDTLIQNDLIQLFTDIKRYTAFPTSSLAAIVCETVILAFSMYDVDYCARLVYLLCVGCSQLAGRAELRSFVDPRVVNDDKCRADCTELFLKAMDKLEVDRLASDLEYVNLKGVLRDWDFPCLGAAFQIVDKLLGLLDATQLLPYAQLLESYAKPKVLLEYKRNAYGFFVKAYEKHASTGKQDSEPLTKLCLDALIGGTADPSDEIQDAVLDFWRVDAGIPHGSVERLKHLLGLYSPRVHASYAQFLALMMLELAVQAPESERLLYGRLVQCHYEDYEIVASRTRRRSKTRAPLFAPSLLAQLERAVAQQGSRLRRSIEKERSHEAATHVVPETILEQLERLMGSKTSVAATSSRGPIPDPSENMLSKRIPEDSSTKTFHNSSRNATQEYFRRLRKEARTQRESVKINRKYRLGNYPDVEISQSSVVASLQGLARADHDFAADLVVSLISALVKLNPGLQSTVEDTCKRALKQPNDFAAPALEILLRCGSNGYDAHDVTKIAESMGLHASAILLLEKSSIRRNEALYTVLENKKLTGVLVLEHRLQLAKLYKCIGHRDVVSNIIEDWTLPAISDDLRRGYVAEMEGDWSTAGAAYEKGYDVEVGDAQQHCLDGMFRCFNELSSWTRIDEKINLILNDDYNSIWQNPNKDSLLPWIFTGQLHKMLDDLETSKPSRLPLMEYLDDWISERGVELTKKFGDQISMLYLCNDPPSEATSRYCLEQCLDGAKERWTDSGPFAVRLKLRLLDTFNIAKDIDAFLRTLSSDNRTSALRNLMRYWEDDSAKTQYDFHTWKLRMKYRLAISFILVKMFHSADVEPDVRADLLILTCNQRLKITELAIKHRKYILAQKHILSIKQSLDEIDATGNKFEKFHHELSLVSSTYNLLRGNVESKIEEKLSRYVISWKLGQSLVTNGAVDISTRIKAKHQIFKVTLAISDFMQKDTECLHLVTHNRFITTTLDVTSSVEIEYALHNYRYNALKSVCYEGSIEEMMRSREIFAKYCYFMISDKYDRNLNDLKDFVEAVLTAMTIGCTSIIYYFPCLLKYLLHRKSEQNMQLFIDNCRNVPTWMFLYWQEQIVSQLASSLKPLVLPIVERLAKDYPSAIIYTFRAICEAHPRLCEDPAIDAVYKTLFADQRIETFFNSMKYLCQPEQYLKYHLLKIVRMSNDCSAVVEALDTFVTEILADDHMIYIRGAVHKRVFTKHRNDLENLKNATNMRDLKKCIEHFCTRLDKAMLTRINNEKESLRLDSYSPYLSHFSDEVIMLEVPGQYSSKERPLVRHHPRIARIDGLVQIPDGSLRIGLIGTDARTYHFLVTIESSARQQERAQRILEMMNDSLHSDPCCKNKLLRVVTYCAVPLSRSMSLARTIDGTKSLKECIEFSMSDKTVLETVSMKYRNWIEQVSNDKTTSKSLVYKDALLKYGAVDVIAKMKELDGCVPWDLLRKTFIRLSSSADIFIQLRQKFITSYATMCIVHWILGVGNRLLENIHIEMKTGKCLGTDFSLMFGAGLDLPIPELVPFRLTTQILGLLRPFREQDLLGSIMSDVLHALRSDKNLILDCLEIFMYEPFDWNEKVNRLWWDDDEKHEGMRLIVIKTNAHVKWISKIKMSILMKKLNGAKPSNIMLEELSYLYENTDYNLQCFAIFGYIINGNELHHTTARIALNKNDLTAKEQVQCLLDQATDANVLGRMWVGWHPFV